jgi:hypothetical protein
MENRKFGLFSADDNIEPLDELYRKVGVPTRDRLYQLASVLKQEFISGGTCAASGTANPLLGDVIDKLYKITGIDPWFLQQVADLVEAELELTGKRLDDVSANELMLLKRWGFSDRRLGEILAVPETTVRKRRTELGITAVRKMVDTCGAEFAAMTPYYYTTFGETDEAPQHI